LVLQAISFAVLVNPGSEKLIVDASKPVQ